LAIHATLIFCSAVSLVPFVWMVLLSFKPLSEVEQTSPLPRQWHPQNYPEVFKQVPFGHYYFNSFFVSAWVTFLVVLTSALAAYAFARLRWPGRDAVFKLYLATMMIPGLVTMIPNYSLMVKLQMLDSYQGLIVPSAFSAFGTFMLRQFMMSVHPALDESAEIDGATPWTVFWDVIMPLCRPSLATLAIFTFMGTYGSFFWPLILIKSEYLRTLPIGLMYFDSQYGTATNLIMAASVMSLVPLVLLFIFGQKFFVKGIMLGGVKG
jgi:multiple sugar transport system permease protein